ncbi:unnamed protein product [Aphanomyces euteiches]|uniref:Uncharacterized protein n=1 Tax=Aphanomyces euteiches TaxID=100861 RepID=A0A6G0XF15_9STRA|nr:hypothetical protein Ae201684_005389 [Aphanomyces euteiches]KAH9092574.1 hypothetical protein Ae201684P_008248 [Aphanomyces euteiches]KAH9157606.1 hypothetical protein AeRB84_000542 [Aphanomyces euteiches]
MFALRVGESKGSLVRTLVGRSLHSSGHAMHNLPTIKLNGKNLSIRVAAMGALGLACASSCTHAHSQGKMDLTAPIKGTAGSGSSKKNARDGTGDDPSSDSMVKFFCGATAGAVTTLAVKTAAWFAVGVAACVQGAMLLGLADWKHVEETGKNVWKELKRTFDGSYISRSDGQVNWKKLGKDFMSGRLDWSKLEEDVNALGGKKDDLHDIRRAFEEFQVWATKTVYSVEFVFGAALGVALMN